MKKRGVIETVALCALTLVLVLLVGSRAAERNRTVTVIPIGGISTMTVDNDTEIVAQKPVTPTPVPTPSPLDLKPDIDISSWQYMLVNNDHNIGGYTPNVAQIGDSASYFDSRAIEALTAFLQAAEDAGYTTYINTAYRPYSAQEYIFNGKASQIAWGGTYTYEEAVEMARSIVAFPGTSEHQTGLACDITDKYYATLAADEMDSYLMSWLADNCAQYGFIARYPLNKQYLTGWYEPWHFRYVGVEAAEFIMENNLCLEEFVALYQ